MPPLIEISVTPAPGTVARLLRAKMDSVQRQVVAEVDAFDIEMQSRIVSEELHGQVLKQRTGKLAGSIRVIPAQASGEAVEGSVEGGGGPAWYGKLHEEGVGHGWAINPVRAKALRFEIGGQVVFAKYAFHPGLKARPFMRPMADQMRGELPGRIEGAITRGLTSGL